MDAIRYFSLGESALTVEFGNSISSDLNRRSVALAEALEKAPFPGFIEAVPAYASTTVFYDLNEVRRSFPEFENAFSAVRDLTDLLLKELSVGEEKRQRSVEIPVRFDTESGPDLSIVAERSGLSTDSVIEIFTGTLYRVYMLGFLPGFSYMGEVDDRIAAARKETPRARVARGSVGIAGKQTGIYSLESPGGWQIIGRTEIELFRPKADPPSFLQPGDQVRFVPVE